MRTVRGVGLGWRPCEQGGTLRARCLTWALCHGPLAQLAEHRTFNPLVAGSSPARPTGRGDRVGRPRPKHDPARTCGAVWSARHPVKVEVAGSNPVRSARSLGSTLVPGSAGHARSGRPGREVRDRPGHGQVAQLVEHTTENRGVGGSIPPLTTNTDSGSCGPIRDRIRCFGRLSFTALPGATIQIRANSTRAVRRLWITQAGSQPGRRTVAAKAGPRRECTPWGSVNCPRVPSRCASDTAAPRTRPPIGHASWPSRPSRSFELTLWRDDAPQSRATPWTPPERGVRHPARLRSQRQSTSGSHRLQQPS